MTLLAGCSGFFVYPGTTTTGTGGGTGTGTGTGTGNTAGDYVYVGNATTGTLSAFAVGTGTLTALSNSPYTLNFSPVAVAVNPANTLLYVAGPALIYAYAINGDGTLSTLNNGSPVAIVGVASMDISPDGQWLVVLDSNGISIDEFQINPNSGLLTQATGATYSVSNATVVPRSLKVSPNGTLIFAALGTGGDVVLSLDEPTGVITPLQQLSLGSTTTSDNALAVSPSNNFVYIARSGTGGGLAAYAVAANTGALSAITGSPFAAGTQPFSVALNLAGTDVYVANRGDNTISGYSIGTSGALAPLTASPYSAGSAVAGLVADRSGSYLLAIANGGTPDLALYSFDTTTTGKLDLAANIATGVDPTGPDALAATH